MPPAAATVTFTAIHGPRQRAQHPPRRRGARQGPRLILAAVAAAAVTVAVVFALRPGNSRSTARLDETFDGTALDASVWRTCHWWNDNGCTIDSNAELEWYLPDNVTVADGRLQLTARQRSVEGSDGKTHRYTSGMVSTGPAEQRGDPLFEFTYGRAEARVRAPSGDGLWAAFWLLPSTTESRPEIDIMELLGNDPTKWIFHAHPKDRGAESEGTTVSGPDASAGWHDIGIEWEPGSIRWLLDGEEVWSVEGDQVPDEPMYLVLNLAVGGDYPGPPTDATPFPATFEVDRVTVTPAPE